MKYFKNVIILILISSFPFIAFADKVKFSFTNTSDEMLDVKFTQVGSCLRESRTVAIKPKTSQQFYTAEGSFCDPTGEWVLRVMHHNNKNARFIYDFYIKKHVGSCSVTTKNTNSFELNLSGICHRK